MRENILHKEAAAAQKHFLSTATLLTLHRNWFSQFHCNFGEMERARAQGTNSISRKKQNKTPNWKSSCFQNRVSLTWHELSEGFGAGGRDGQGELVDGDPVGDGESIDAPVGRLSR